MGFMRSGAVDGGYYVDLVRCSCHNFGPGGLLAVLDEWLLVALEDVGEGVCFHGKRGYDQEEWREREH